MPSPMVAAISTNVAMVFIRICVLTSPRSEAWNPDPDKEAAGIMVPPIPGEMWCRIYRNRISGVKLARTHNQVTFRPSLDKSAFRKMAFRRFPVDDNPVYQDLTHRFR